MELTTDSVDSKRPGKTVYLDRAQWLAIDELASRRQISATAVIREAVREYLAGERQREAVAA